jgi:hypothetical protein
MGVDLPLSSALEVLPRSGPPATCKILPANRVEREAPRGSGSGMAKKIPKAFSANKTLCTNPMRFN